MHQKPYLSTELGAQDAKQAHASAELHAPGAYEFVPRQLHCRRKQYSVSGLAASMWGSTQDEGVEAIAEGGPRSHAGISQHEESWPRGMRRLRPHLTAGFEAAETTGDQHCWLREVFATALEHISVGGVDSRSLTC